MAMSRREAGKKGGEALAEKRGPEYMAEIGRNGGKKGFLTTCLRWFQGDKEACLSWIQKMQVEREMDRLVSKRQDRALADGAKIVCDEIPIVLSADDDVTFNMPEVTWEERCQPKGGKRAR
jgi:hypothetical protein